MSQLGLTPLGIIHTAIGLIAVAAGLVAFFRDKGISSTNPLGKLYVWTTVITCLTGFGIYQHGGFGKPHVLGVLGVLGVLTLLVLTVAWVAGVLFAAFLISATLQIRGLKAKAQQPHKNG